ncbi:hypothetical protein CDEST_09287 [Colletotrichum destructivum]|uniref:Uncharacterized protein n=1 Tax=Colletotrichum destructivum TaxID=34406 RepID=A0AAX4IL31_9PEZI|nr:hypothetical protein CDEST_09287 [Colletotrichum destructivum]
MFATLRTEDRHGEVVCISSTNRPPQPGQNQNHFACDGCRAKKPRRRKVERTSAFDNDTSNSTGLSPPLGERLSTSLSVEAAKTTAAAQTIITTSAEGVRPEQSLPAAHPKPARGSQIGESLVPAPGFIDSNQSSQSCELLPDTSPDFQDLDLPDYMESNMNDFDMDELLDVDAALSEQDAEALEMGSTFATCTSPKDKTTTRESSLATSNSSSDDIQWNLIDYSSRKRAGEHQSRQFVSAKKTSSTSSPQRISSTIPFSSYKEAGAHATDSPTVTVANVYRHQARKVSPFRTATSLTSVATTCRCVNVTLTLLEKVQSYSKVTSFCTAEKSLHSLKGLMSQCQGILNCPECRNPPRVMTFSVLLTEKVVGLLEDIASVWESTTLACGSDGNAAQIEMHGHAHRWVPISLGQYHIDTVQERCEIFGFLILVQVKNLGSLLDRLRLHAEERRLESQQSSLQPIALRVQELQEALSGINI